MPVNFDYLWWGLGIGFWISVPVGPVGVLCIRRLLTESRPAGFVSGVGAATADAIYAALAAFGITFISGFLASYHHQLRVVAALFLLFLGVRTFRAEPRISCGPPRVVGLLGDWASTLALALSNLVIALELAAIFAAFNLTLLEGGAASVVLLVAGVFGGSVLLWGTLTVASTFINFRFDRKALLWINRAAGALITGFGLLVLLSLVLKHG